MCEFGSHTSSHIPLNKLKYETQIDEIKSAHSNLERVLKMNLDYFSFPYGTNQTRNFKSEFIVSETCKYNFSCDGGINKNPELKLNLSRIGIHNENKADLKKLILKQLYK